MLLASSFLRKRARERIENDPGGARLRAAPRRLRAALRDVAADGRDPWGDLRRAVESFLADRYGTEVRGRTWERLRDYLVERGANPQAAENLSKTLTEIEARRYRSEEATPTAELADTVRVVSDLTARLGGR